MRKIDYFILCALPLLVSCGNTEKQVVEAEYATMTVSLSDQTLMSDYPAVLRGRQTVEIRPQVSGTITEIRIDEGENVRRGQILFIIDQTPYRAALQTAVANVKSAEAKLNTARMTAESKEKLYEAKIISDFDRQTALNQLLEAEAALEQAKAEETNARNNLSYTEVKSPVNGVTSMIPYRVGALVDGNITEPLVTVSDDQNIHAYFSMDENAMLDLLGRYGTLDEALRDFPPVTLTMSNGKRYPQEGRIDAISGTVDESTGGVTIRALFPNEGHLLRNGGSATVSIPTTYSDRIVIPQSATYELQNRVFTWRVIDGKAKSTPIEIYKYNDGTNYIVLSGLDEGDTIIAEGAGLVREDTVITVDSTSNNTK